VDRQFVDRLVDVLRRHGTPVWYSETNIRGAQQWHDKIGAALRRCDWFVLVLSPDAAASKWVERELLYSLPARPLRTTNGRESTSRAFRRDETASARRDRESCCMLRGAVNGPRSSPIGIGVE